MVLNNQVDGKSISVFSATFAIFCLWFPFRVFKAWYGDYFDLSVNGLGYGPYYFLLAMTGILIVVIYAAYRSGRLGFKDVAALAAPLATVAAAIYTIVQNDVLKALVLHLIAESAFPAAATIFIIIIVVLGMVLIEYAVARGKKPI